MATRDRAPEIQSPAPFLAGGDPAEYQTTPEEEAISEIDRLVAEAGPESGFQVAVYRKAADGLRYNYIRRLPLVGFEIDKLPETYGGGQYLLRVNNERNRIVKTVRVAFDPAVHPATPPAAAPAGAGTFAGGSVPGDLRELVLQMARDRDQDRKDNQQFLQTLVTALLTRNTTSNAPTLPELMDAQLKMRELAAPTTKGEPEVILQALKLGLETAAGRAPGADDEGGGDIFTKLIDKIGIPLIEAINRRTAAPRNPAAGGSALPPAKSASAGGPGAPAQATGLPPELEPFAFMRQWTPYLLGWAQSSFDPQRAAAVIYNVVPDPYLPVLEDFLSKAPAERFSILVQLDPRLQAYQSYTERITTALKAEMGDDDTDDGEPAAPGDQGSDQP